MGVGYIRWGGVVCMAQQYSQATPRSPQDLSAPSELLMKRGAGADSGNISQSPPLGGSKEGLCPGPAPGHQGPQSFIGIFIKPPLPALGPVPILLLVLRRNSKGFYEQRDEAESGLAPSCADTGWAMPSAYFLCTEPE